MNEEYYPEADQWRLIYGSKMVITTQGNGRYHSRVYVNKGQTATTTSAIHVTRQGVRRWAGEVLAR